MRRVVAIAFLGLLALSSCARVSKRSPTVQDGCEVGEHVVVGGPPYRKGYFVDQWVACDLTLEKKGTFFSGVTETVGGGLCELSCEQLVSRSADQILIADAWYSADRGRSFASLSTLLPYELRGVTQSQFELCDRYSLQDDGLLVRFWRTCDAASREPPSRSLLTKNGGRSWDVVPTHE